jgi:hypothetical protein
MDIFELCYRLIGDYWAFVGGLMDISDEAVSAHVMKRMNNGLRWQVRCLPQNHGPWLDLIDVWGSSGPLWTVGFMGGTPARGSLAW